MNTTVLGNIGFKNRSALQWLLQLLLKRLGPVAAPWTPLLQDVLRMHPDASQKGSAIRFEVGVIAPYKTRGFRLVRPDGTSTDFSYLKCLKGVDNEGDMRAAARTAVVQQQLSVKDRAFARSGSIVCPVSGETITRKTCHVDHEAPNTFDVIFRAFTKEFGILPVRPTADNETETKFLHDADAHAFAVFHHQRAKLRVVSRTANLSTLRKA